MHQRLRISSVFLSLLVVLLPGATASAGSWQDTGTRAYWSDLQDWLGIGTSAPLGKLDLRDGDMVLGSLNKQFLLHTPRGLLDPPFLSIAPRGIGPNGWDITKALTLWNDGTLQLGGGTSKLSAGKANSSDLEYGTSYEGFNATRAASGSWVLDGDGAHNGGNVIFGNIAGDLRIATVPSTGTGQQSLNDPQIMGETKFVLWRDGTLRLGRGTGKHSIGRADFPDLDYGTSYNGFNAERTADGYWVLDGDGAHNGGNVVYGNIAGDLRFATILSVGGGQQVLTDPDIVGATKMSLWKNGTLRLGNGTVKHSVGRADSPDLDYGTSYDGFNAERTEAGEWVFDYDEAHNGGNVIYGNVAGDLRFVTVPDSGVGRQILSDSEILAATKMILHKDGTLQSRIGIDKAVLGSAYDTHLGFGTSYLGFNTMRNPNSWTFEGDNSHNGGNVVFGDVLGQLRFVSVESTGGNRKGLYDSEIMSRTRMMIFPDGHVEIPPAPGIAQLVVTPGAQSPYMVAIEGNSSLNTGEGVMGYGAIGIHGYTSQPVSGWAGYFDGDIYSSGNYYKVSDARFKKDIVPLQDGALSKIMQIEPKQFRFSTDQFPGARFPEGTQYGFIAQDVEKILPELVAESKAIADPTMLMDPAKGRDTVSGYKLMDYTQLIPILSKAIQEQQKIIDSQAVRLNRIEAALENLGVKLGESGASDGTKTEAIRTTTSGEDNQGLTFPFSLGVAPNPSNSQTMIRFSIPDAEVVKLAIYDVSGRLVHTLVNERKEAGAYSIAWNGEDSGGTRLPSGIYLARLETETQSQLVERVILLR